MNQFKYFFTLDSQRTELVFSPIDWEKNTIATYKRSMDYFGVLRSLALPMDFVLDAANILEIALSKYGFEAVVLFEIEKLNKRTLQYKTVFKSNIDFSKFKFSGDVFSAAMADNGPAEKIKAQEGIKYEYELTGDDIVNIILPGVAFSEESTFVFNSPGPSDRFMPSIDLVVNESGSGFVTLQNVGQEENLNDDVFATSGNWFVKGNRDNGIPIRLKGNIKVDAYRPPLTDHGNDFAILIKDQSNGTVRQIFQSPSLNQAQHYIYDIPFDFDMNIGKDQRLFFYIRTDVKPSDLKVTITEGEFSISYSSISDPSNCKGISAFSLYKRILTKIIPGTTIQSSLLSSVWENLIFTSGDGIREIAKSKVKITFKEFFETFQGIEDAGFGFENDVACLEYRTYFFRNGQALDLGLISNDDCELSVAEELIGNTIKIGYEDGNTDESDGKQEYNSKQVWALPINRISKEINWISPVRADQYGIEKLRVDYNVKKTKSTNDTSSDNTVFMLDCFVDGINYRPILGSSYDLVTGVISPATCYNLNLSPKSNLMRHNAYLRSILDKRDGFYIFFASGEKNTELETLKDGKRIKENENIAVTSLGQPYFMPYYATVTTGLPKNTLDMIDGAPFNYIKWTWKNKTWKGYLIDVSVDIAQNTQREFKLLLTQDNKL